MIRAAAIALALVAIYAAASSGPVGRALLLAGAAVVGSVVALAAIGAALIGRDR